ncbi:MAG: 16S rRNA (cytosine(967)-C(5))-methyltransferase RsmB [Candidatus Edwardsbacteria bacterium]|nr:16S rRNA (cytosine(967)-C(5))-methyltransferase RsmB [Candidatus Edwardsbacteria bacterium]
MTARETALNILSAIDQNTEFSDSILRKYFSQAGLSRVDQNLARELVSGVLRQRAKLDWLLDGSLKRGLKSLNTLEANILRLGLYQVAFLDKIPAFAAVNESVELVKRFGRKEIIGLTNAVLRDIIRNKKYLKKPDTGDKVKDAGIEYSHPEWLIERWAKQLGWDDALKILEFNNSPAPVIIRANRLKASAENLFEQLKAGGFGPKCLEILPQAIEIDNPSGLVDNELFVRGHFYFQDFSAQAAGMLFGAKEGDNILDLCAAPGGKAGLALEQAGGRADMFALDRSFRKLPRVRENFIRLGLDSWYLINGDAVDIKFKTAFDLVLADVPCTGLGVIRRRLDLRWRIREADIQRMAGLQSRILENAAGLVKPGGALVYSTCTLTPEENQDQVKGFLIRHPEFRLDPAEKYLPAALAQDGFLAAWPQLHQMDGAFAARLIKSKNI